MSEIRQTELFAKWLSGISDPRAAQRIAQRIVRLQSGLFGDVKPVGQGISSSESIMARAIESISFNAAGH
jgi:putative addiction module killer protein